MSKDPRRQSIEPAVLAELAEKAVKEEKALENPYLKALMKRLGSVALELKAALENEGYLEGNRVHPSEADHTD
jgi:hypothetical protein